MDFTCEYRDRLQLFKDCMNLKTPKKIPFYSNFYSWKVFDSDRGYKLSECLSDYSKMEQVVREFHERYHFDTYQELGTRVMYTPFDELGSRYMVVDDDIGSIQYTEHAPMNGDEYPDFANQRKELYYKMFLRRFPELTYSKMAAAIQKFLEYGDFVRHMNRVFTEEYACPPISNLENTAGTLFSPFDIFFQFYRGVQGASLDMRKHKGDMLKALDAFYNDDLVSRLESNLSTDNSNYVCDVRIGMLAHSILNPKQFDEFYWPYIERMINCIVKSGKTVCLSVQSFIGRFADYFKNIPKGHAILQFEMDDPFELRKKLPNICLAGGMKSSMLGHGTPKENVEYVKRLINEMGPGFILCQDKFMAYRNDCKRENLLAVAEFVHNYRP